MSVLLSELEGFVVAARHDEELNRRTEVVELLEESSNRREQKNIATLPRCVFKHCKLF